MKFSQQGLKKPVLGTMAIATPITDTKEVDTFVRTHLAHRLSALVSPVCRPQAEWGGRNDAYRAAKEGSFVMLRLFIEFLGVKSSQWPKSSGVFVLKKRSAIAGDIRNEDIVLSRFSLPDLDSADFSPDEDLILRVHQKLSKVTAHFTYDVPNHPECYDRITSVADRDWEAGVEKVVGLLDRHFYVPLQNYPIVVHWDLVEPFKRKFPSLITKVEGGDLGR